jgi:competence protein ComEC
LTGRARAAAVAALLAAAAAAARPSAPTGRLEVWLHACGHGLAATAILPDGSALQIDAGSRDVPDLARRRLRQALDDLGVRRFEAVSLSHADADHANAVAELLERYGASRVVCALENPWRDVLARRTLDVLIEEGALHRAGASAHWILVRAPTSASDNDRAIATVLEYAGRRVLFPADLERAGIAELLRRLPAGPIDVLVMPHHALENGQVEPLLDAVKPSIALASNGGRYSTRATEDFLARRGLRLRATRDHGTLRLRIAPDGSVLLTSMPPD